MKCIQHLRGRRGRDRMVVGFTTTYVISAYHHWCFVFESRSGRGVQHYVMKFVSDLRQVSGFLWVIWFPPPIKLTSVLNMPVLSIYPEHGNPQIRAHLNRMVYPRDGGSDLKTHICWRPREWTWTTIIGFQIILYQSCQYRFLKARLTNMCNSL